MQPRLLLVPHITELEWVIRPELEGWAEVATFDVPGVGDEPAVEPLDRQAIVDRALLELDRREWDSYILSRCRKHRASAATTLERCGSSARRSSRPPQAP